MHYAYESPHKDRYMFVCVWLSVCVCVYFTQFYWKCFPLPKHLCDSNDINIRGSAGCVLGVLLPWRRRRTLPTFYPHTLLVWFKWVWFFFFAERLTVNTPGLSEITVVKYLGVKVNYWRLKAALQPLVRALLAWETRTCCSCECRNHLSRSAQMGLQRSSLNLIADIRRLRSQQHQQHMILIID